MATFRKRGAYQWQAQVRKKGQPLQTKTLETRALAEQWARAIEVEMDKGVFISRAEAESTTLKELFERYLAEITPRKKGAASETNRLRTLMRLPTTDRVTDACRPARNPVCWRPAARRVIPGCCPSCNWRWRPPCARGS